MNPSRNGFLDYSPALDGSHVISASGEQIHVAGRGRYCASVNGRTCVFPDWLHIPHLQMPLISVRQFLRMGQGCSFLADNTGYFLTFPEFIIDVDDLMDCVVNFTPAPTATHFDFNGRTVPDIPNFRPVSTFLGNANKVTTTGYNLAPRPTIPVTSNVVPYLAKPSGTYVNRNLFHQRKILRLYCLARADLRTFVNI